MTKLAKTILEDGSKIDHKKKFLPFGVFTHISNGSGVKSEQRNLMCKLEAQKVAERERAKGNMARVVRHGKMYLVYYRWGHLVAAV